MAINTYATLKTAAATFMMGASDVTTNAADLVALSQGWFNSHLRHREMVTTTTLSPTSGVFTLPSNFTSARMVYESASIRRVLRPVTLERAFEIYPDLPSGLGEYYAIYGDSLRVFPTITNNIVVYYYKKFTALSADTDWLLTDYPHIYLKACQMFAADLLKDDAEYTKHAATLQVMVDQLHGQESMNEYGNAVMATEGWNP